MVYDEWKASKDKFFVYRPTGKWWFGCTSGNIRANGFSGLNNNNGVLNIRALKKNEAKARLGFIDEGDETLDAEDPES